VTKEQNTSFALTRNVVAPVDPPLGERRDTHAEEQKRVSSFWQRYRLAFLLLLAGDLHER
jgi:hypothetical protein